MADQLQSRYAMAEHKVLENRLDSIADSFRELKEEVKSHQTKHGEALDSIKDSLKSIVLLEERSVGIQDTMGKMRKEQQDAIERVHSRIDGTLKDVASQGVEYTRHVIDLKDKVHGISRVVEGHTTEIKNLMWFQRIIIGTVFMAIIYYVTNYKM